jgi:hypothetical protein
MLQLELDRAEITQGGVEPLAITVNLNVFEHVCLGLLARCKAIPIPDTQQDERRRYHVVCDAPPPPTNTLCDKRRWLLNQAKLCKRLRDDYTNKYFDGKNNEGHQQYMGDLDRRIRKLERWIERFFSQCPQTA